MISTDWISVAVLYYSLRRGPDPYVKSVVVVEGEGEEVRRGGVVGGGGQNTQ